MVTRAYTSSSDEQLSQSLHDRSLRAFSPRIRATFTELAAQRRKGLIPFVTAGHPHPNCTVAVLHALAKAGADVVELGIPFSDPMADGPVIQRASEAALQHGMCLNTVLDMVAAFRKSNTQTPIVLMGYANPIEQMGLDAFASKAKHAGVDGVLVVDYPPEESQALAATLHAGGIDLICLLAPTSSKARIAQVLNMASGFIYYVALNGVTGAAHLDALQVTSQLPELREHSQTPLAVGFGIRDAASACAIAHQADAVVIGSALVKCLQDSATVAPQPVLENLANAVADAAYAFLHPIRQALDAQFHSHS